MLLLGIGMGFSGDHHVLLLIGLLLLLRPGLKIWSGVRHRVKQRETHLMVKRRPPPTTTWD